MFPNSIIVFDDLDSGPFTGKDEVTGEFIYMLDATNNKDFKGFILATVNDPSKLHSSLINRPERVDEVIHVKNVTSIEEAVDIIFHKAKNMGYSMNDENPNDDINQLIIDFNKDDSELIDIINTKVIPNSFTQAMVSSIISDAHYKLVTNKLSVNDIRNAIDSRMESISTANMVAKKGRLYVDLDAISDEAMANLSRKGKMY